jgi:hypothetical protein
MDIVSRIPAPVSGRLASPGAASYANSGVVYDYAIGGLPFLSGASDERPLRIGMAPIKKDQFDNEREPGEQSLAGWWLRSQSTFIGGEGLLYQDPDLVQVANIQNRHAIQYGHGLGVNPWTNGQLTLLRATAQRIADSSADSHLVLGYHDDADRYWSAVGSVLKSDDGTTATSVTWGGTGTIVSLTADGTNYYVADATGVYSGTGAGSGALAWNTGTADTVVRWVKGRLMAGIGASVYELVGAGGPTLPTAKMTHLNGSFVWTDFAEGTDSIFACGYAGAQGAVYKFVLDGTGAVPTLASGGVLTAQLPLGEVVYCMASYLGTYVGLGTSRGFRLAQIDSNGDLAYGPLLIEISGGVRGIAAYDRFFFVGGTNNLDGKSGLWRVDLGQPIQSGSDGAVRFAYATDLQAGVTGTVSAVTNFGTSDRMAFAVVGSGSYLESADTLVETGYLQTGRVRFSTLEPKIFKFLSVRTTEPLAGSVSASVGDPSGAVTNVFTAGESGGARIEDVILPAPATAVEWAQLRLDLDRSSTDDTAGPTVTGWQFKALPGSVRQRIFEVPLALFDREKTASGQIVGQDGRTVQRLEEFAALARRGDAVSFQDLSTGMSYLVVVDDYQFEQKASPGLGKNVFGGYLTVQLRTIAEVIS